MKEKLLTNSAGTFNDRGRKRTESDAIVEIQTQEIAKLKDTIAGITTENLQIKKACYNKSSVLTTSRFIGIATADPIGFSHPVIKESGKLRSERSISKRGDPMLRTFSSKKSML